MKWVCEKGHVNTGSTNTYPTHCLTCGVYWGDGGAFIEGTEDGYVPISSTTQTISIFAPCKDLILASLGAIALVIKMFYAIVYNIILYIWQAFWWNVE